MTGAPPAYAPLDPAQVRGTLHLCIYIRGDVGWQADLASRMRDRFGALGPAKMEVVDINEDPARADTDMILATPTIARLAPPPVRLVVGDIPADDEDRFDRALAALGIASPGRALLGRPAPPSEFERLAASLPAAVLVVAKDSRIVYANRAADSLMGVERGPLIGTRFPHDTSTIGPRIVSIERHRGGEDLVRLSTASLVWQGRDVHLVVLQEVPDAPGSGTLSEGAAREGASSADWTWDLHTDTMRYSATCARVLGVGPDELGERFETWRARIHPDDLARVETALQAHKLGATRSQSIEHRVVRPGGEVRWVRATSVAEISDDGEPARLIGSFEDITRIHDLERALAEERAILRSINENTHEVILLLDAHAEIRFASPAARRILASAPDELSGRSFYQLVHPGDVDAVMRAHGRALARGEESELSVRLVASPGAPEVDVVVRPYSEEEGDTRIAVVFLGRRREEG